MKAPCVMWQADMEPLGDAVVAIGVFDGVHIGHQALLEHVVDDAHRLHAASVAVTFDRDPDQVVTPATAAPQLLSLDDKCSFMAQCGVDTVLIVPFTPAIASTHAEEFLDDVLRCSAKVRAIHVGADFRFGAGAAGDVSTLRRWADAHGALVVAHELTLSDGIPVTSTRIRALIAQGDVEGAGRLLGRPHRVTGLVCEGRRQGRQLGFPTANLAPSEFAALPADGVYAGLAVLGDDTTWPAAISVGTPPSFPEAREYLEAHLIGFAGDLYDEHLSVEFLERLRDNRAFESLEALSEAIGADVARVTDIVSASHPTSPLGDDEPADDELIDDPAALQAAEDAVAKIDHKDPYEDFDASWVEVLGPVTLVNVSAGLRAFEITGPLADESIPFAWDPMPPGDLTSVRPELSQAQRFHLYVPPEHAQRARQLVAWWEEADSAE